MSHNHCLPSASRWPNGAERCCKPPQSCELPPEHDWCDGRVADGVDPRLQRAPGLLCKRCCATAAIATVSDEARWGVAAGKRMYRALWGLVWESKEPLCRR